MAAIAYLVLTHGQPYQTIDLLWSVWREEDAYFVHVDRKSPAHTHAAIEAIAAAYPNIHVVPSGLCTWGGFTLVDAALRCLTAALATDRFWTHTVLLSGTHLPLRRAVDFAGMLDPECSYLNFHDLDLDVANLEPPNWWTGVARRLTFEYEEVPGLGHISGPARRVPPEVTFFWGSQWWILSRQAAEFVCGSRQSSVARFFRRVAVPDEMYFQTILANSPLKKQIRHQQIIWQRWGGNGRPCLLSDTDLTAAFASRQFFARKAGSATMRDGTGVLAQSVASMDRASWLESVTTAFANFLPPSIAASITDDYRQGEDTGTTRTGKDFVTRSFINEISAMIGHIASEYGLAAQMSSSVSAEGVAALACRFPGSRTEARYSLIARFCNLEIAWIGLYVGPTDIQKAVADLQKFPHPELLDLNFPQVRGLDSHHEFLEFGLRKKGVVWLDGHRSAENLQAVVREYLEILSNIPGMVWTEARS